MQTVRTIMTQLEADDAVALRTARLHSYIQSHGFQSWTYSGIIEIAVPATRRLTDGSIEVTEEIVRCQPTLAAVRTALGY